MLGSLIIVFREVFEAGLIIGIVLAVTRGVPTRGRWITGGILAGILGACIVAAFAGALSAMLEGVGQELFNAAILIIAVFMLTWHNVWMARHGREMARDMRTIGEAVAQGSKSLLALAIVIMVAVLREGSEIVLFLYGIVATDSSTGLSLLAGGVIGLLLGTLVSFLTYAGFMVIPARYLFGVTTALIALLSAGMAAQAVTFLERAGMITLLDKTMWDSSWLLTQDSLLGSALHTLVGYNDQPTQMQLLIYIAVLATTFLLMRAFAPAQKLSAALQKT